LNARRLSVQFGTTEAHAFLSAYPRINHFDSGEIMLRQLLVVCLLAVACSKHVRHRRWGATTLRPAVGLHDIPIIGFGEHISFHANQTLLHVRTKELYMGIRDRQCAEARFRVEGKRTR
jgi:hypothetical protein